MAKQLRISIANDGAIQIETIGIHGPKCLDYVALMEDLVGGEITASSFTEDYSKVALEDERVQGVEDVGR